MSPVESDCQLFLLFQSSLAQGRNFATGQPELIYLELPPVALISH